MAAQGAILQNHNNELVTCERLSWSKYTCIAAVLARLLTMCLRALGLVKSTCISAAMATALTVTCGLLALVKDSCTARSSGTPADWVVTCRH